MARIPPAPLCKPLCTCADFSPLFNCCSGGNRTLAEAFQFKYGKIPEEFTKPRKRKTIVGVGIELRSAEPGSPDAGLFVVGDTTPGGPAARAGVRPLARVLAVDGARVAGCGWWAVRMA